MDALDRSAELVRRGEKLRARSGRMHAATAERMAKSRRWLADAAQVHDAVLHAHDGEPTARKPYRQPGVPASVRSVEPAPRDPRSTAEDLGTAPLEMEALVQKSQEARARAQAIRDQIRQGRSQRQVLHQSAYARLAAKHESMPVIEQAKGIIMAQRGCGPEEAFDLLRRASQRSNVKVHVLATQIVGNITASDKGDNVTPLTVGAKRQPRPGRRARPPAG